MHIIFNILLQKFKSNDTFLRLTINKLLTDKGKAKYPP